MYSEVHIIGAASGRGEKDTRCADGPCKLQQMGLTSWLGVHGVVARWEKTFTAGSAQTDLEAVAALCKQLSNAIAKCVSLQECFAVIGGDHSCAIGTWSGAYRGLGGEAPLGMIWIDAHMDSHLPDTSPSGAIHGMPLACLLGFGPTRLTGMTRNGPPLQPQHVCLIGVRSYENQEAALLSRLGVQTFFIEDINKFGLETIMSKALEIACSDTAGFGVSIDLDAIDPKDAPAVATPAENGLSAKALLSSLRRISSRQQLLGVEIAEFNPYLDRNDLTAGLIHQLLAAMLGQKE